MGGVYVFTNDAMSFMQNPAYSCYTSGLNVTLFDVSVGIGDLDVYTNLTEDADTLPDITDFAQFSDYFGDNIGVDAGGFTAFTLPCFGFAGFYTVTSQIELQNPAYPYLDTFYATDYGVRIGGAFKLAPFLSFGLNAKRVTRKGGPYTFGASSLIEIGTEGIEGMLEDIENEGVGWGLDAGLVSRFESLPFNPTLSLSWRDVGSTSFVKTKGSDEPGRQKDNLVLGATIDGSIPLLGMAAGLEYRHVTDTNEQIGKKLHGGIELSLAFFDFRAGLYQGYPTYGIGTHLWIFQLDAALFSVEKGVYPGQTPEKRAHVGILLDLEFDPNFNLVDTGGRKRRLKQRR